MKHRIAISIPMKGTNSLRVPGKNLRMLGEHPLYMWTIYSLQGLSTAICDVDIFIDTESEFIYNTVRAYMEQYQGLDVINHHKRDPVLSKDEANGNHLLEGFFKKRPDYDFYIQTHITTPFTSGKTYRQIIDKLVAGEESLYTAQWFTGWIRQNNNPINYNCKNQNGLGRSQDKRLIQETTDTYAVSKEFFAKYRVRSNELSTPILCNEVEAIDIDTEIDFKIAKIIAESIQADYNFKELPEF